MTGPTIPRQVRLKPRLVRVKPHGYAPDLLWGLVLTAKRPSQTIDVVLVRASPYAPAERRTVAVTDLSQACLMTAPEGVLVNLVKAGSLTPGEYAEWQRLRVMGRIEAESWMREVPMSRATRPHRPRHDLGKGHLTKEARRFIR